MTDFLLELRSEEIPARMQDKARDDLARLFAAELDKAGLKASALETFATPRRLGVGQDPRGVREQQRTGRPGPAPSGRGSGDGGSECGVRGCHGLPVDGASD